MTAQPNSARGPRRGGGRGRSRGAVGARTRQTKGASLVGQQFEVTVGPVAHGGHCVARVVEYDNRVVFVRHTLPGERVVVSITEGSEGDRFWRGDAVRVLSASEDRVEAPCAVSGPGGCGGCDFQHVALPAQRDLKSAVVREQLSRLAGLDLPVTVEAVPGDQDGLRWRTRTKFVRTAEGTPGLRKFRSHDVVAVEDCLITIPSASTDAPAVDDVVVETVTAAGVEHAFVRAADGFWQVHPGAPRVLVETVLQMLDPKPGESVLDLYSGVGLFARFLADRTGESSRVVAVEGDRTATRHASANLAGLERFSAVTGSVDHVLAESLGEPFDLVVLDPPREGAKAKVVAQIVDRAPRAVAYVACDPAALARDLAHFAALGYQVTELRAFDLFPMTSHVEVVALLEPVRG